MSLYILKIVHINDNYGNKITYISYDTYSQGDCHDFEIGGYIKMFRGCKHACATRKSTLINNTKNKKRERIGAIGGGGGHLPTGGSLRFTPPSPRACKHITVHSPHGPYDAFIASYPD